MANIAFFVCFFPKDRTDEIQVVIKENYKRNYRKVSRKVNSNDQREGAVMPQSLNVTDAYRLGGVKTC